MRVIAALLILTSASVVAQLPTFNLVAPASLGKVTLPPPSGTWQPAEAALYDEGTRPALLYHDSSRDINLSVLLFPREGGHASAESCRDAFIPGLMGALKEHGAVLEGESQTGSKTAENLPLAIASYTIAKQGKLPLQQRNLFAFAGKDHSCAEVHISKVKARPEDQQAFTAIAEHFSIDLDYKPTAQDFEVMGVLFYQGAKNYAAAAVFYQHAYDTLSSDQHKSRMGRYVADQLTMSYGIAGDLARSRATAEAAISVDPDYPLYYYNLACADAESGDGKSAATHLQQAFDRRANVLTGESFPDPVKDDSLQKLKMDDHFWDLATKISAQLHR